MPKKITISNPTGREVKEAARTLPKRSSTGGRVLDEQKKTITKAKKNRSKLKKN